MRGRSVRNDFRTPSALTAPQQPQRGKQREVNMRRVIARSVLVASIAAGSLSATAFGHECFVISRSDTGDIAAGSHAQVWETLGSLEDLFGFVGSFLGLPPLSDTQLAWAVEAAGEAGLPNQLTLFTGNHTIAEGTPAMEMHAADGTGVDHVIDWFPVIIGIYVDALSH
jgi:hypothetical protein